MACLSTMNAGPPRCSLEHLDKWCSKASQLPFSTLNTHLDFTLILLSGEEEAYCKAKFSYSSYVTMAPLLKTH